jgi:hypothetical protein
MEIRGDDQSSSDGKEVSDPDARKGVELPPLEVPPPGMFTPPAPRPTLVLPSPTGPQPPRLLDRVRQAIRARHYSPRTEKAYVAWIRRFIFFHRKRHPDDMGSPEVAQFLSHLATSGRVSASTQNQAFSALLFL